MIGVSGDVLSDVLHSIRLTAAVYFDFDLSAPWVAEAPPAREIAGTVMPGAQRVIEYHLIARGSCWAHIVGQPPVRLAEGDVVLFPQGDPHVLSSAPGMRASADMSLYVRARTSLPLVYEGGGGGPQRTRIVCCFLGCDAEVAAAVGYESEATLSRAFKKLVGEAPSVWRRLNARPA
jgi:hypothetical protein